MKKNKNVVCMLAMASIIAPSVASIDFNENNVAYASDSVEKSVKYVTRGNGGGDGSQGNPYQGIEEAINNAPAGSTLILTSNVSTQNANSIKLIKNLIIDGQGLYELELKGSSFELNSNFTFKNLNLAILRDGRYIPKIYANGHKLEFDNVSTKVSNGQQNERPELYGGSNSGDSSGSKSIIIIKGDNTESKFAKIYAKGSTDRNDIPVDITVDSSNTNVLQGMDLSSVGAPVNVVTKSKNIKTFVGDAGGKISLSVEKKEGEDKLEIDNVNLTNIQNITLKDSKLRLTGNPGHVNNLNLTDKKSELILNSNIFADEDIYSSPNVFSVSNITGAGTLEIPTDYKLALPNSYDGTANVRINNNSQELDKKEMYITSKNGNINFTYTTEPINKLKKDESGNYVVVDASEVDNSPVTPAPEETPDESTGSDSAGNTGEGGTPGGNDNAENGDGSTEGNGGTPNETGSGTPGAQPSPGLNPGASNGTGTGTEDGSGKPEEGSQPGGNAGTSNETGSGTPGAGTPNENVEGGDNTEGSEAGNLPNSNSEDGTSGGNTVTPPAPGTNTDTPETQPSPGAQPGGTVTEDGSGKPNPGENAGTGADSEKPEIPGDNENLVKPEKPESPKPDGNPSGEQPGDTGSSGKPEEGSESSGTGADSEKPNTGGSEVTPPAPGKDTDSTTPGVEPGTQPGVDTTKPNDSTIPGVTENSNIITPKEIDHKLVENIGDTTVEVLIKDLDSKNYKLKVQDVTKEHEADVLSKISEKVESIKIFDINLVDVNTDTIVKTDKDRTVRVLLTENLEDKTVKVYYVDDITGELTLVPSSVENNTVVFSVNHFSKYAVTISKNNDNQKLPNTGGLSNNNSILGIITMIIALGMSYIRRVFKK